MKTWAISCRAHGATIGLTIRLTGVPTRLPISGGRDLHWDLATERAAYERRQALGCGAGDQESSMKVCVTTQVSLVSSRESDVSAWRGPEQRRADAGGGYDDRGIEVFGSNSPATAIANARSRPPVALLSVRILAPTDNPPAESGQLPPTTARTSQK